MTTAFARPISAEEKGWRTQLAGEMMSLSINVTRKPGMSSHQHRLVQVRQTGCDRAAISSTADDENSDLAP